MGIENIIFFTLIVLSFITVFVYSFIFFLNKYKENENKNIYDSVCSDLFKSNKVEYFLLHDFLKSFILKTIDKKDLIDVTMNKYYISIFCSSDVIQKDVFYYLCDEFVMKHGLDRKSFNNVFVFNQDLSIKYDNKYMDDDEFEVSIKHLFKI